MQISIKALKSFIKYNVSVAVTFTAITGYIVYAQSINLEILTLVLGVFLLAGGSSSLNEVQEYKYDALMERTKNRPLPTGEFTLKQAIVISSFFILSGTLVLYVQFGIIPALLGLFNIFWYNGLYTPYKRISAFAVVPGSLVGAVPAFIGWTAAGGYVFDATIVFIGLFLFIWQVPHFWLLMFKYGTQYEGAGFPTINHVFSKFGLKKVIFVWVLCTSFIALIIPLFLSQLSFWFFLMVFTLNLIFIGLFAKLAFNTTEEINFRKSFIGINIYMMFFMLMLIGFHLF
ncbi:MAG: hypothetical protein AUK44_02850 [Porphyromonadaceae bacterium CG2_30_38_12]|nr:MAG: hypothetical protein AUK44_02850 [Porphyromonadaceae bacterium CG2_30_38_12]